MQCSTPAARSGRRPGCGGKHRPWAAALPRSLGRGAPETAPIFCLGIGTLGVVLRSASGSGFPPPRPASPRGGSEQELEGRGPRPARAHRGRGRLGDDPCPRRPRPMRCRAWGAAQSRREQLGFRRLGPCAMAAGPLTRAAARPVRGAVGTCAPALLPNSDPFLASHRGPLHCCPQGPLHLPLSLLPLSMHSANGTHGRCQMAGEECSAPVCRGPSVP